MSKITKSRFFSLGTSGLSHLLSLGIPMRAAYAGYFIILSVFPALLLIVSSLRLTGLQIEVLLETMESVLPEALYPTVQRIVMNTYRSSTGAVAGLSALTALWSSSKGIYSLLLGLNAVYGVKENRGFVYTRAISVLYSLGFILVLLLTLVLHVFGNIIMEFLLGVDNPILMFFIDLIDMRTVFLLAVQTLLFTLVFMVFPNRRNGFFESLPGALLTSGGWWAFSALYSVYLNHFGFYANIYGGVYAVAIAMLWLYFCMSILLYGGALNAMLVKLRQLLHKPEKEEESPAEE